VEDPSLVPGPRLVGPAGYVRGLLGAGERLPVSLPLKRRAAPGGAPRMRWIAEAVKKDALGWLVRSGGWRVRHVVAGGRRREARVWDPKVWGRLGVRFTAGPLRLLVAAMEADGSLPQLGERTAEVVTAGLEGDDPATGDLLALHRAVSRLRQATRRGGRPGKRARRLRAAECPACGQTLKLRGGGPAPEQCPACEAPIALEDLAGWGQAPKPNPALHDALLELSPLSLAFDPEAAGRLERHHDDPAAGEAAVAARLAPLFRGDRPALLSYLDDALARAWLEGEARRRELPAEAALESYRDVVRGLGGYARAASEHPDALRPLIAFFEGYVVRRFGGRAEVGADLRALAQGFDRASERETLLHAAGELFALGRRVDAACEDALAESYVDRTERQKVLLADYHRRFRDVAPAVEAIRRELVGEIG
jgi:hypothetical protein